MALKFVVFSDGPVFEIDHSNTETTCSFRPRFVFKFNEIIQLKLVMHAMLYMVINDVAEEWVYEIFFVNSKFPILGALLGHNFVSRLSTL